MSSLTTTRIWAPIRPFASIPARVRRLLQVGGDIVRTYNDRVRRFSLAGRAIAQIRSVGNLVMPFFHLHTESDNFAHVKVERRAVFVFPDPHLVGVVTALVSSLDAID